MNLKTAFAVLAAAFAAAALEAKDQYDIRPGESSSAALTAVEWQATNATQLAAATTPEALAAHVATAEAAATPLEKVVYAVEDASQIRAGDLRASPLRHDRVGVLAGLGRGRGDFKAQGSLFGGAASYGLVVFNELRLRQRKRNCKNHAEVHERILPNTTCACNRFSTKNFFHFRQR